MTLMIAPYRLGMSLRPYRLGMMMIEPNVQDPTTLNPAEGPFSPGLVRSPVIVPCPGYMTQNGAMSNVARPCNPDGTPFLVADTLPIVASIPTSDGQTPVGNPGASAPPGQTVIVTPTSGTIPPPHIPVIAASSPNWFTQSMIAGIPNWAVVGLGALLLLGGKK